jgi:RNA polymerase sigma-70 factor (ECF subfamily)
MLTDEDLALGVQQGRTADLNGLVERHFGPLVGYLYRMTGGDRMLSEDMAQETFLRVLRAIRSYAYPRPFKPWLYAIATNLARNHYRQADTRHTISSPEDGLSANIPADSAPEDTLLEDASVQEVIGALWALPVHQREVVVLRYYQELPLAEVAETLGIPIGTVKSRLSLGLGRLRELLEVKEHERE